MRRVPWKKLRNIVLHGTPYCWCCKRRFKKNEPKFLMYPPVLGGESVCASCKAKERGVNA